ncbi:MAG: ATP-grasp domain-containing protein [Methanotrichaceae archaeon]|nr:ATP-grasp domain-containing protein [Methanotrichaceae archaeon]
MSKEHMSNQIFVTDSQMRNSLAVIRSLGKKGLKVTAGEVTRFSTGRFSKYCTRSVVYPSPEIRPDSFIKYLKAYIKENRFDAIFPITDLSIRPIIDNEDELSRYTTIALPSRDIFLKGYDKGITLKIARENDIPTPKTFQIESLDDVHKYNFEFPVIIKPRLGFGKRGFSICRSLEDLINKINNNYDIYGKFLIQEFIPNGGEFGIYTLFNYESEPRALSVQRRIRSYPVSGGPSTLRETFRSDLSEKALRYSIDLLKAMKWFGVAMVEFRIDPRDGLPKLMEVNPRFWGSLHLSILAGIDFPYLLYKMIIDGDVEPEMEYAEGIKCRWILPGDILWYLSEKNKVKNLPQLLDLATPDDILSWNDPGPTFGFAIASLRYIFDVDMWKFILKNN